MAEAEGIPPTASVASVGPGISYIGKNPMYGYALSGTVSVDNSVTDLLNYTTGSGFQVMEWDTTSVAADDTHMGDEYTFWLYFNNLVVAVNSHETAGDWRQNPIKLIAPPFTLVIVKAQNRTDTTANNCYTQITGRVYGAV